MSWNFKLPKLNIKNLMAFITVTGVLGLLYFIAIHEIPEKNRDVFNMALGIVIRSAFDPIYRALFPQKKETEPGTVTTEVTASSKTA